MPFFRQWWRAAWHIAFPRLCLHCRRQSAVRNHHFCMTCLMDYVETDYHLHPDNPVAMHFYGRVPIERATSLLDYKKGQLSQTLLRQFKYEGRVDIGRILGKRLGEKMKESGFLKGIQGIIPVPLHPKKRRLRGFNQSFIFAEGLEEVSHCPVKNHWIRRHEFTSSQTKKTRLQRIENVSNAFSLQPNIEEIPPGHYLLVDDVVTTGATLEAVAKVCLDSNDVKLSVASIALG